MPSDQPQAAIFSRLAPRPPKPPEESHSRAGRNLKAAIPTALILLALVAASIFIRIEVFAGLVVVALGIAQWEMAGALLARNFKIPLLVLIAGQTAMAVGTWFYGIQAALIIYMVTCVLALLVNGYARAAGVTDALAGCFSLGWIGLMGSFAVAMATMPHGAWVITAFILLPVANDTGGWLAGVLFGKHPISPSISPKKSWEGFAGSVIACFLVAWFFVGSMVGLSWPWVVLFALVTPVMSTAGDFSESLLKRDLAIKDMGSIFPGHGGMLDRIDSILFCAPACYLMFAGGLGLL
ncbi:phosphatidate cytidylyltransferase [Trueperella sp. HMSC08B05]|uniref:Phosphatidate cytidylyltransferase n=1 Tax=Trueperella bernardiae TaxID=59561 RepID=A0A0W1KLY3_9ACTO|nr:MULTISPECIES: phosphatidate cytidylyltransferase [Trueperella]KTF04755.1 Phosphatidate cytidylyltransferase [Trueperella bernardiae]MDK8601300.1 phosphatidate cytidylyltransferase [Trueperella bernardiae]MDV6238189.1 phosphatidate cytidylyltransferase [Trueperella bernardiae]OFS65755.1 phosphatidate cytidylyltransferase [Trueperella sp. HMSC08H06]OFS75813.1 phosphatidate cytidylyltransferase [Trueperella sp. HMSC08B05]